MLTCCANFVNYKLKLRLVEHAETDVGVWCNRPEKCALDIRR